MRENLINVFMMRVKVRSGIRFILKNKIIGRIR